MSMVAATSRQSDPDWVVAAVIALVAHLIGFLVAGLMMMSYLIELSNQPDPQSISKKEEIIELSPDFFKRVVTPPVTPQATPEEKKFARTSAEQESKDAPQQTRYIGERNTKAASEAIPTDQALAVPTQDGEKAKSPEQIETFDETFAEGEEDRPDPAKVTPQEQAQSSQVSTEETQAENSAPSPEQAPENFLPPEPEPKMVEEELADTSEQEADFLETSQALERPEKELPKANDPQKEKSSERPKESNKLSKNEKKSGGTSGAQSAQETTPQNQPKSDQRSGREVKKTLLKGSISRRGKSSLAVEKTALGRYQAALGKAIEIEWQKNVIQYREHVVPGYLTVRFAVDAEGKVTGLRFIESSQSGGIQNGFTLRAIQTAEIPKMPKGLAKELSGEGLELIYNFHF